MSIARPKLTQNIFEARYERGYRYLDRCGDAMVILEEALPEISNGRVWMPEQMVPVGARIKCPELDIIVAFDTYRLCVDQNPVDTECDFVGISEYTHNTIVSKFEIKTINRLGHRQIYAIGTDSIEEAESLTLKKIPINNWPVKDLDGLTNKARNVKLEFANDDNTKGFRFAVKPFFKREAPVAIDERLNMPPHLLKEKQREVLLDQLRRHKRRETDPDAGILADIDYWWLNPQKVDVGAFVTDAQGIISKILEKFVGI